MHNQNKASVNPYLTFGGNCREAMTFYKDSLNGELEMLPFKGSPMEVAEEYQDKIMHATLRFGDAVIMASDSMPGQEIQSGNAVHISIASPNLEEAEKSFENLSKGGTVTMPFEETFWGAKFGMLTDKFGIHWMVNCELK